MAHWNYRELEDGSTDYICSECCGRFNNHDIPLIGYSEECPLCDSKMDGSYENIENKETKGAGKKMERKTKQELLNEIEEKNKEIKELKKEVELVERYKAYKDMACEMKMAMDAYVESGFTEDQAFALVQEMINGAMNIAVKNMR